LDGISEAVIRYKDQIAVCPSYARHLIFAPLPQILSELFIACKRARVVADAGPRS
jgi:hypothetical protein